MFYKANKDDYRQAVSGIGLKTLVYGKETLLSEFRMEKGSILPKHSHPHEQTGYLVKGKINLTIGNDIFEASPGDCWCIKGNVEHCAEILEDSIAVEVFSPIREDYLPENQA